MSELIKSKDNLGREIIYNPDRKRMIFVAPFGIACYEYKEDGRTANANHRGIVATDADAEEWLSGGSPKLITIYKQVNTKPEA